MFSRVLANVCRTLTHAGRSVKPIGLACVLPALGAPAARADGN